MGSFSKASVVFILLFAANARGDSTDHPAAAALADETAKVKDLQQEIGESDKAAIDRLASDPDYVAAKKDCDEKKKALTRARETGTPEERLAASSAFNQSRGKLSAMERSASTEAVQLRKQLNSENLKLKPLQAAAEAERKDEAVIEENERKQKALSDSIKNAPEITKKQIEITPEKFKNQVVRIVDWKFRELDNTWVDYLPGVTVASNGLTSRIDLSEKEKWIGIWASDANGDSFSRIFAKKDDWVDSLMKWKNGQKFSALVLVTQLDRLGGDYGLVCLDIETDANKLHVGKQ